MSRRPVVFDAMSVAFSVYWCDVGVNSVFGEHPTIQLSLKDKGDATSHEFKDKAPQKITQISR